MMDDLISRQAAIDAECEVCRIAPKKERGHNCIYYVNGCKEIECLRALPSAQPTLRPTCDKLAIDCISRQAALEAAGRIIERDTSGNNDVVKAMTAWREFVKGLPSAQPELIEKEAYIRGFEQGRTQGMIDAQGVKK